MASEVENGRDISGQLSETVREAAAHDTALAIVGGGTKRFYGRQTDGQPLAVAGHRGILAYEPTELVITARAGTPLAEIEAALAGRHQMLGFEPPHFADRIEARGAGQGGPDGAFGAAATLGGVIACGISGPRRPWAGSARDFVLGAKILNGKGEILRFGGQVMKNVAGFDVSRLMAGALGTLGVLLEISLKVMPQPEEELTLVFELPADRAITAMNEWSGQPLPLSAACHLGGTLYIRMSGAGTALRAAHAKLGGASVDETEAPWQELREHRRRFFDGDVPLWRLSVPPATPPMNLPGKWLLDWGGAQRWFRSGAPATEIRLTAEAVGGHATLFRGGDRADEVFHPLPPALQALHRRLKQAFDPQRILNPARLYAAL